MVLISAPRGQNSLFLVPQKDVHFLFFQNHLVNSNKFLPARDGTESAGGQHQLLEAMYVRICINWCLQFNKWFVSLSKS